MDTTGLTHVRSEMKRAADRAGVPIDEITLVAISKGRSNEQVAEIARAGQRVFGENRQQGLAGRMAAESLEGVQWHFVGPLQSRKVPFVERTTCLLHSMDRMSLARKWVAAGDTPVLLQFNLAGEPQKSGFDPSDADEVIDAVLTVGLDVRGVMAIPPLTEKAEASRRYFGKLRAIFDHYRDDHANMEYCSMGMSNDFAVAIEEGSTMVRVGRAIFESTDR